MTGPDLLLALLTLALLTGAASAQQRTLYDSSGRAVVRSVTGSNGAVTNYDQQIGHCGRFGRQSR